MGQWSLPCLQQHHPHQTQARCGPGVGQSRLCSTEEVSNQREGEKGKRAADGQSDITSFVSRVPLHNGMGWNGMGGKDPERCWPFQSFHHDTLQQTQTLQPIISESSECFFRFLYLYFPHNSFRRQSELGYPSLRDLQFRNGMQTIPLY